MKRVKTGLAAGLLMWLALAGAQTPSQTQLTPNFQNVDIVVLADAVGKATGLTFVPDPRVRGPANLVNPQPMTPQQLYEAFLSVLQVNGFATSRTGNMVKIVPEAIIARMPGNDMPATINPNSEEFVTTVIELKNISAQQLNPLIRQLLPQTSTVFSVTGTNSLVIVDRAANVARLQSLATALDESGGSGVDMIRLENSNASEVARTLTTLLQGTPADAAGGGAPRIVADERSNSILVSGDTATRQRVSSHIASLDQPVTDVDNIEMRYLKYARAEEVATKLKNVSGTIVAQTSGNAGAAAGVAAAGGGAASSASTDRTVNIEFDPDTNMLIVMAPGPTRRELMRVVDYMDIARAQVLIEAIIADVSMDDARDLGVNWAVFSQEDGTVVPGALFDSPVAGTDIATLATTVADPASATSVPQGATFALGRLVDNGISWAAMLRALESMSNTNVIARPTQTTLDNEEVNLESGQEVPLLSGSYTNTGVGGIGGGLGGGGGAGGGGGGIGSPFQTLNRTQLGTKLRITPQLNGSDAMTLTIDLESSELSGSTGDAGSAITNVRKFHNVLHAKDQQWIVVGGLIRDSETSGENRVPLLSRIPLLGHLFKTKNKARSKKNLMVFIKPTIITDNLDANAVTNSKYREILETQEDQRDRVPLQSPQLPPMLPPSDSGTTAPGPQTSPVP